MLQQKINDYVTYVLVALLFAPHAVKECVTTCTDVVFIQPTLQAFLTPFVSMDISLHGFLMQLLWAPPFVFGMWVLFWLRDHTAYGTYFHVYALRWGIFFLMVTVMYNAFFWGGLREYVLPSFIF
jgi:hypothetical protein